VSDFSNNQVLKLPAGASSPSVLPFTGLHDPDDVAVDTAGNVYLLDSMNFRVLKLTAK
jgi:serine/threonine-protein kinase